jgi:ribonuclease HI
MDSNSSSIAFDLYTDGSCHTQYKVGGWAAILWSNEKKIVLSGLVERTTNNRMELTAVIEALAFIRKNYPAVKSIRIYSDSQYVIGLPGRKEKLTLLGYSTKKGNPIPNSDLVINLLEQLNFFSVEWMKIKAHQKTGTLVNFNREADKLSRKLVREAVK